MNWKVLLVVVVAFSLLGFFGFTQEGRKYSEIIKNSLGGFTKILGSFVATFSKSKPSSVFEFELLSEKEAILGQTFSFSGSKISSTCRILNLKIDGKTWEISDKINLSLEGKGSLNFDVSGRVKLNVEASQFKLDSFKTSEAKVEMELLPEKIYLSNISQELINLTLVTGSVLKRSEGLMISANFTKASLLIENFLGSIELGERLKIYGTASEIDINGKKI